MDLEDMVQVGPGKGRKLLHKGVATRDGLAMGSFNPNNMVPHPPTLQAAPNLITHIS